MSVVVATILVAGALVFPLRWRVRIRMRRRAIITTAFRLAALKDNGNVGHGNTGTANIGNGNVGSHNVGNGNTGSNFVGDPLPGVDCRHPSSSQVLMRALTNSQMMQLTLGPKPRFYQ